MFDELLRRARTAPPGDLATIIAAVLAPVGVADVGLFLVDYEQSALQPISETNLSVGESVALDLATTIAGRAYVDQAVIESDAGHGRCYWVPVSERALRLGVLRIGVADDDDGSGSGSGTGTGTGTGDDKLLALVGLLPEVGLLVGQLLSTGTKYTDQFEMGRRRLNMNLAAELQWQLLPPLAYAADGVAITGLLEPAYEIGGDVFDYSVNGPLVDVAVFDAMGHGLEAAQSASLAVGTYRYCRRRRLHLTEIATTVDVAVEHLFERESYVTGQLLQLDLTNRMVRWVNAGHPEPLLLRNGRVVAEPHVEPCVPFGLGSQVAAIGELQLEPGDHLLLFSDGSLEARTEDGQQFGRDGLQEAIEREYSPDHTPGEFLRRLVRSVQKYRGAALEDDVTFVLISVSDAVGAF